ncbi:unnamed protein product [Rotaria sordida]|uniref:Transmembrane protein n=1 Tax=Rotaria sordida TaxID=392033 RepID=A0A815YRD8_9BILA|nr:unnamed protein product [Rotaria sordida]CAF1573918.1 unnamed protein product [Rotaria sordida]
MIKAIFPTNSFDQFLSSYEEEEDHVSIDDNNDIHSILVYIGLITIILFFLLLIFSLINKCMKIFHDETITTMKTKQQQIRYKRYQSNFLINRQTNMSSIPSSSFLINYQSNNILSKPSLCATLRMLQYKQEKLSSIVNV